MGRHNAAPGSSPFSWPSLIHHGSLGGSIKDRRDKNEDGRAIKEVSNSRMHNTSGDGTPAPFVRLRH
ncbi:hypothetical protein B296_00036200 [Ensete ventricosum]|uniref:Uncharacterized protein n=1 Tax=Ensete ventricosum TaxID=4639 RepID=A0A426YQL1_ENSVE|nr:hypothetical protein B296_00036200 [Ensete ventricosum]